MELSKEKMADFYRNMWRIRHFEEIVVREFKAGNIPGFIHVGVGEEATMAGVVPQLRKSDYVSPTHRGHGVTLMKGIDPKLMFAELCARETGLCKGRGGSMHLASLANGVLGANGILGACAPIATGVAHGIKYKELDDVVVCYFGDGQFNEGAFHEALNLAACMKLPIVYLCTNNLFGMFSPLERTSGNKNLVERGAAYGMPGVAVDGNDVLAVYEAAETAIARARSGDGPSFLELKTYRYYPHAIGSPDPHRTQSDIDEWRAQRDPIDRLGKLLLEQQHHQKADLEDIEKKAQDEMENALLWALEQPFPLATEVTKYVYTNLAVEGRSI